MYKFTLIQPLKLIFDKEDQQKISPVHETMNVNYIHPNKTNAEIFDRVMHKGHFCIV